MAAACSALLSYEQLVLSNNNLKKSEQIAAFDNYISSASDYCASFSNSNIEAVWDYSIDDFTNHIDMTTLFKTNIDLQKKLQYSMINNVDLAGSNKTASSLNFQYERLYRLISKNIDMTAINAFETETRMPIDLFKDINAHGDNLNQLRFLIRSYHGLQTRCYGLLHDVTASYDSILSK